jgi:hypothetical protein
MALMCRAVKVLCVAPDEASLAALRRASVGAGWELAPGATDLRSALDQVDVERPHALVVFGPFDELVALVADRFPGVRIVTDRDAPGASAVAGSADEVRDLLTQLPRPGGPVRS